MPRFYFIVAFLVGFVQPITIGFIGKIPLSEFLLVIVLIHSAIALAITHALPVRVASSRALVFVLICQVIAFASYIVADLWRQSLPSDMARGWLRMIFLLLDITALALLFAAGNRTFVLLQIGLAFSAVLTFLNGPLFGNYWKFCFAYPVTILVLLVVPRFLGSAATIAASFGLGVLHLLMGYRSLGMQCLLLAVLLAAATSLPRLWRKYLLIASIPIALAAMSWAATSVLGTSAAGSGRSNVERSAMLQAAWEGFLASPLVGNGSWFSRSDVWDNFLLIRSQKEFETGGGLGFDSRDFEGIAIHSQILTALAEGGVLGASFFLVYTLLILSGLWYLLTDAPWHWLMPIRLSILISGLCSVFMSPFSGTIRVEIALTVCLTLILLDEKRSLLFKGARWQVARTKPAAIGGRPSIASRAYTTDTP